MKVCLKCGVKYDDDKWICTECNNQPKIIKSVVVHEFEHSSAELGFPQEAFAELYELEQNHFWFRARSQLLIWAISRYFSKATNFLEIGCGTGLFLQYLSNEYPDMQLTGSDISLVGLSYAVRRVKKARLIQFNIMNLPYCEEFDLIGTFDVIEHIGDDLLALKKVNQALVSGGGLIITVPQHPFLWSAVDRINQHKRRYRLNELRSLLNESGFEIIRTTSFVSLLLPFMVLKRLFIRNNRKQTLLLEELKLNTFINKIFEIVMAFERLFIKLGINFICGGSLLVVSRKKQ